MVDEVKENDDLVKVNQIQRLRDYNTRMMSLLLQLDTRLNVYDLSGHIEQRKKQHDALEDALRTLKTLQDEHGDKLPSDQSSIDLLNEVIALALRMKY